MYGTSTAVHQTTGGKHSCGMTYRIRRTDMDMAIKISVYQKGKGDITTYALPADPEIAPLQLPEDFQELLEEPGDLRCELVVVADARLALREARLPVTHDSARCCMHAYMSRWIDSDAPRLAAPPRGRWRDSSSSRGCCIKIDEHPWNLRARHDLATHGVGSDWPQDQAIYVRRRVTSRATAAPLLTRLTNGSVLLQ